MGACAQPAAGPKQSQQASPPKEEPAELSPAKAQKMYEEGLAKFKEGDYEASFRLWVKAAEGGSAEAAAAAARSCNYGQGTPCDYAKAAEWYTKAAQMGHIDSMYQIGDIYQQGKGVVQDEALAFEWISKAADYNHREGLYALGVIYTMGRGTQPNRELGMDLIRQAAELGHESAMKTVELYDMLPDLVERQKVRHQAAESSPTPDKEE